MFQLPQLGCLPTNNYLPVMRGEIFEGNGIAISNVVHHLGK